jgi:hypothetical protein
MSFGHARIKLYGFIKLGNGSVRVAFAETGDAAFDTVLGRILALSLSGSGRKEDDQGNQGQGKSSHEKASRNWKEAAKEYPSRTRDLLSASLHFGVKG